VSRGQLREDKVKAEAALGRKDGKCGTCVKLVEDGVQCEICDQWFHPHCQGISESLYKMLVDYKDDIHWFCQGCRGGAEKLLLVMSKLQTKVDRLEDELVRATNEVKKDFSQKLKDLQSELRKEIGKEWEQVQSTIKASQSKMDTVVGELHAKVVEFGDRLEQSDCKADVQEVGDGGAKKLWSSVVEQKILGVTEDVKALKQTTVQICQDREEQCEIEKRKNCAVIQGLTEPIGDDAETRKRQDKDRITEILHELQCDDVSVNAAIRLGKLPAQGEAKIRPVKIIFSSEEQKERVLSKAKNLKSKGSLGLDRVFIHQDLTPKQRMQRNLLVKELKDRQAAGEQGLIIVNNKIVTRKPRLESMESA